MSNFNEGNEGMLRLSRSRTCIPTNALLLRYRGWWISRINFGLGCLRILKQDSISESCQALVYTTPSAKRSWGSHISSRANLTLLQLHSNWIVFEKNENHQNKHLIQICNVLSSLTESVLRCGLVPKWAVPHERRQPQDRSLIDFQLRTKCCKPVIQIIPLCQLDQIHTVTKLTNYSRLEMI